MSNLDQIELNRKISIKNAQEKQNALLKTEPDIHSNARMPENVLSDLIVDNYHRGMIKAQRECQTVLHRAFNQITEQGNKWSLQGWAGFKSTIPRTQKTFSMRSPFFLRDTLVEEYKKGQEYIRSTFSKNDEFLI